jgi:hypothetical protein
MMSMRSESLGWGVKRESVERRSVEREGIVALGTLHALTLYAPTLHAPDARQSQFVRIPPKAPKLLLRGPLPLRALAALMLLSLLLGSPGCGTSGPPAKPPPGGASAAPRVDELNLVTMPVAVNLESKLGINGINVKVYASDYQRPKTQPVKDGTLEILMFEGLVGDSFDQTNRCRHLWSFQAWELAPYAVTTTVGTGYLFPLAWGKDQPRADKITVVARYQPPQGRTIYSAPSYISIAPPPSSLPQSSPPPSSPAPPSPKK